MPVMTQDVADRALAIQTTLNRTVEAVRMNRDLTGEAKQQQILKAYAAGKRDMDALQTSFVGNASTTARAATQDVFGAASSVGVDAISARDADDRAAQLADPQAALDLLARAESNGDAVLGRAIASRAFRDAQGLFGGGGWTSVLDNYVESHPEVGTRLQELADAQAAGRNQGLANAAVFFMVKPTEIALVSDWAIATAS